MITNIFELQKGDIVFYRNGRINYVNDFGNYIRYYNEDFENISKPKSLDIMKIKRYVKILWFYKLKTFYEREE